MQIMIMMYTNYDYDVENRLCYYWWWKM